MGNCFSSPDTPSGMASCGNTLPGPSVTGGIYTTGRAERRCAGSRSLPAPTPLGGWGGRRSSPEGERREWEGGEPGPLPAGAGGDGGLVPPGPPPPPDLPPSSPLLSVELRHT